MKAGQLLHQQAGEAIRLFRIGDEAVRVDPRNCLIDPRNRDGTLMNSKRVHSLLADILASGWTHMKSQTGIVVDIPPARMDEVLAHNKKVTEGDNLLPDVSPRDQALYTVLHTNHYVMIARCFYYQTDTTEDVRKLGVTNTEGKLCLNMLHVVDPPFAAHIRAGLGMVRLGGSL